MKPKVKNREPNGAELGQILALTRKIQKEAVKQGVEMSKTKARKMAAAHYGFVDQRDYENLQKETHSENAFKDGVKSALPKFRNL